MIHALWSAALHFTGVSNVSGAWYGFWSGFGSDIGEVAVGVGVYAGVRHINCNVTGCKALVTHPVLHTPYRACRRHHPAINERAVCTVAEIQKAHDEARADRGRAA